MLIPKFLLVIFAYKMIFIFKHKFDKDLRANIVNGLSSHQCALQQQAKIVEFVDSEISRIKYLTYRLIKSQQKLNCFLEQ